MNPTTTSSRPKYWLYFLLIFPMLWVLYLTQTTSFNFDPQAAKQVPQAQQLWTWAELQHWYVWINLGTIIFPFLLSFDRKVHFYRKWPWLFWGMLATAAFFLAWDVYFTHLGVWGFNERYCSFYLMGLPAGEWLFFFTVPYACIFTHECLRAYFPKDSFKRLDLPLSILLGPICFLIGLWHLDRAYTSWTFLLSGGLVSLHYCLVPNTYRTYFYRSYLVCLLPFALVNGILTGYFNEEPVVLYHDGHNLAGYLGSRFLSIPYDDFIYGFLLLFLNVMGFEWCRARSEGV